MALLFSATTDVVNCGSDASFTGLDPWTVLMWVKVTTLTNNRYFWSKGAGGSNNRRSVCLLSGTSGDIGVVLDRATTDLNYTSSNTPFSSSSWKFLAVTFHSTNSSNNLVHIYVGSLSTLATEVTYVVRIDGSGAFASDSGESWRVGNLKAESGAIQGTIAYTQVISDELSLAQIRALQFRPRVIPNTKLFLNLGFNGTGTQTDLSGNGNNGTVTGCAVDAHVPISIG